MSLSVCVDARVVPGVAGGLEHATRSLARGLSALTDGDERYLFLVDEENFDWLDLSDSNNSGVLIVPKKRLGGTRRMFRSQTVWAWHRVSPLLGERTVRIPPSPGLAEAAGAEVMHFTTQRAFATALPSIYQPWDLQYLHFPQFFSRRQRLVRRKWDREFCRQAEIVVVGSRFGRDDLSTQLGIRPARIAIVPVGPGSNQAEPSASDVESTRTKFDLPERFALYPAQTWPHKNHLRLLEAIALLRSRGIRVPLICTGRQDDFYKQIRFHVEALGLHDLVKFTGFVHSSELRSMYALAHVVVFPSLFEGGGMPTLEAFSFGVPLTCSNTSCLPEQVGDAAVTFEPTDAADIASAVSRVWSDSDLRRSLIHRGRKRVRSQNWDETARIFRAQYRMLARRGLTPADEELLLSSLGAATDLAQQKNLSRPDQPRKVNTARQQAGSPVTNS